MTVEMNMRSGFADDEAVPLHGASRIETPKRVTITSIAESLSLDWRTDHASRNYLGTTSNSISMMLGLHNVNGQLLYSPRDLLQNHGADITFKSCVGMTLPAHHSRALL